jgi:hypothetical protein
MLRISLARATALVRVPKQRATYQTGLAGERTRRDHLDSITDQVGS